MGVDVIPFESYSDATRCVAQLVAGRDKVFCVAINPEKVFRAGKDPRLLAALRTAEIGICDGIGIVIGARILQGRRLRRCTGCDLFFRLLAEGAEKGWKIFLLGASRESNSKTAARLATMFPHLRRVGRRDGYFPDSGEVVREINESGADLLFVAMGSPRQEFWITEHRQQLDVPFCMGVGGTFDVVSGATTRAPRIFRKTGTEFLFRLIADPRRFRRYLALPRFVMQVLGRRLLGPAA
jgi:N-acetylglucosaminyldiphosphoundecaprenol N-acetyl-beta-D-mannosaminyltransferase